MARAQVETRAGELLHLSQAGDRLKPSMDPEYFSDLLECRLQPFLTLFWSADLFLFGAFLLRDRFLYRHHLSDLGADFGSNTPP